jgi:diaminohydroxyphosphoribosylaminopyrimidine deaminase/5-amino-6-(5-phosphoribosylamino)uracil reductase
MKKSDEYFIKKTFELAEKATGNTSPNPLVGCLIFKNGKIISEAYHKKAGEKHAEKIALEKAGEKAKDAILYVNLEPCCHFGKTPPCTDAIIRSGIKKVVAAMKDPNPLVNGKGFKELKNAGIKIKEGVLKKEAEFLNRIFIKNVTQKKPYIFLKAGISVDGKIALKNGQSKWITSEKSRKHSQILRKMADAILVGINTVLVDNPFLDCRIDKEKRIKKIILDSNCRIPINANLFKNSEPKDIFIFIKKGDKSKIKKLIDEGVNVIIDKSKGNVIDENFVVDNLYKNNIMSVLVEGGSKIATSFLKKRLVDEIYLYISPKIIGNDGISFFGELNFTDLHKIFSIKKTSIVELGSDILLTGTLKYR